MLTFSRLGAQTLLSQHNCVSVRGSDGNGYHLANVFAETIEELIANGKLSYPVEIEPIPDTNAANVTDSRVDPSLYRPYQCDICIQRKGVYKPRFTFYKDPNPNTSDGLLGFKGSTKNEDGSESPGIFFCPYVVKLEPIK